MSNGLDLSVDARADVESGNLDNRLYRTLHELGSHMRLTISVIKTGHPMGPSSPSGVPNNHFFYRAADIIEIDGVPVFRHETSRELLALGHTLRSLPDTFRPDRIYGPSTWHHALGFGPDHGFVSDPFHDEIHADHIHIGYLMEETPAPNEAADS